MLHWLTVFCIAVFAASQSAAQSAGARAAVARGLAALHTFEYEDANDAFREAQRLDPGFAMAYWGEAMTYYQTLWRREDVEEGRRALARLAPSASARAARARTSTEKGLLEAAEILFGEGDALSRHQKYADAMGRLYARDRHDPDVSSLYALALLGTMSRGLIGYEDAREGHVHGLAGSEVQKRAAAILEEVLRAHPQHEGALHYLLHTYDDPEHARLALDAARTLAARAPASSHARHMPSHVFLQLGMWREASASDRSAFDASTEWIRKRNFGPAMRNYHALAWLQYSLLQRGRFRDALNTIGGIEPVVKSTGQLPLLSDLASMRARYAIETRRWSVMAREDNFANVNDLFAIGMSAVKTGDARRAETVRQALAQRARSEKEGDLRPAIAIMEREIAALVEIANGQRDRGLQILEAAAASERQLPPPLGLPQPVKPAPELLGEALLEAGRPREAIAAFEQTLARNANRSLSVLGLARAAAAAGDTATARKRYAQLLANYDEADGDLPELEEARRLTRQR